MQVTRATIAYSSPSTSFGILTPQFTCVEYPPLELPPICASFCGSPSSWGVHSTELWGSGMTASAADTDDVRCDGWESGKDCRVVARNDEVRCGRELQHA